MASMPQRVFDEQLKSTEVKFVLHFAEIWCEELKAYIFSMSRGMVR